ncbi:MAG: DUF1579 family protein [Planctomycetota bacterium]|nr:DUF1579 family protein [Planctomycetota bacterium]
MKLTFSMIFVCGLPLCCIAEEKPKSNPIELEVLKASLGIWDAEIEVWPQGLDAASIKFNGVETVRPYGKHWISADFDSEFMGQTMKILSIVGYDLDQKKLVGTVIDHGPYLARMTGDYDEKSKTVRWKTEAKAADGTPMVQNTSVTQKNANERVLVLSVPGEDKNSFTKFMQITFVKRKS